MEKTGLIVKLYATLDNSWIAYQQIQNTNEAVQRNTFLQSSLSILKEIRSNKDIELALGAEELLLNQELVTYANSPEETNSIKTAITQLQDARSALSVVQDSTAYQDATKTYPAKQKEAGLPMDSFRTFIKSHSTRLSNRMASPLSVPEKNLLRQRKENLGMVKEVYIGMQRQALGMAPLEKSRSLSR